MARAGHSRVDAFRRGERVRVTVDGAEYDTTDAQLRLLRLLEPLPAAAFIRVCDHHVSAFAAQRKEARDAERKRRRCHRVHMEQKAAQRFPVTAWLDCGDELVVDA